MRKAALIFSISISLILLTGKCISPRQVTVHQLENAVFPIGEPRLFYIIGLAEYSKATGDANVLRRAQELFDHEQALIDGLISPPSDNSFKFEPLRAARSFGVPMINIDVCDVMLKADPENSEKYKLRIRTYADEVFRYFFKEDLRCVLENVGPNGEFLSDWTVGREVNPGHGLEGVWFLVKAALTLGDRSIIEKAAKMYEFCLERGWDHEYGGIVMFVDALGFPPEKYEHDMKFWWVIDEAICAALTMYYVTKNNKYLKDFESFTDYYFTYFADHDYGGCFGYLRRDGKPTEPIAKGNIYKGPFHTPRMLMYIDDLLGVLMEEV